MYETRAKPSMWHLCPREREVGLPSPCTYVIKGDGLHHLVLLHGVHLIEVPIGYEDCSVLHLIKAVDL